MLAQAIYREGAKIVAAGHNPMDVKRGIDQRVADRHRRTEEDRQADQGPKKRSRRSAPSRANNDKEVGAKIAEAMPRILR